MDHDQVDEWPIYALANYSGTGELLRLCSHCLCPKRENSGSSSSTNSGSKSIDGNKHSARTTKHKQHEELRWWQLIQDVDQKKQLETRYQTQILLLCSYLCQIVSPFLEVRRAMQESPSSTLDGQPLAEPSVVKDTSERRLGNAGQLKKEQHRLEALESLDVASLRRASWRRDAANRSHLSGDKLTKRILTPLNQTSDSCKKLTSNLSHRDCLISAWMRSAGYRQHQQTNLIHRWSRFPAKRGKYGESLAHILIANQTNEHLVLFVLLMELWPELALDVFVSKKFRGLSCCHLSIAYGNERLLEYLISLCKRYDWTRNFTEQQVTGSLFAPPELKPNGIESSQGIVDRFRAIISKNKVANQTFSSESESDDSVESYWCDRVAHWPAPNGLAHLLIFNSDNQESASDGEKAHQPIYLGSTPLAWCVGYGSRQMYGHLVDSGADQKTTDQLNRTCLHLLAVNNTLGWSRFLIKSGASQLAKDYESRTPLQLACHLGRAELFDEILELSTVEFWSYSMIRCSGYPLTQLDSIIAGDQSAVAAILESKVSTDEQKAQLLSSGVVKRLLEEKWTTFARRLFYRELLLTLAHLCLMTLAISLRPGIVALSESNESVNLTDRATEVGERFAWWWIKLKNMDRQRLVRHMAELTTVTLATVQMIGLGNELRRDRSISRQWTYNPLLPNFVSSNGFILLCVPLRFASIWHSFMADGGLPEIGRQLALAEDVLLIFAAPLHWSSLLFFIAAFRVTGPFVAMIRHMIVFDLRQFSLIYLVFLFAFAQCIFLVNYQQQHPEPTTSSRSVNFTFIGRLLADYSQLLMDLFKMTLGVYDLQPYRHSHLARLFFLLFIYLIPILFNMLIAMMNNTYSLIISQSERAWSFQWARTLFALERRLSQREKDAYLRSYSINMAAPEPSSADITEVGTVSQEVDDVQPSQQLQEIPEQQKKFVPALMIIKRMDKTRAERRRRVVGFWQRSLRRILSDIEKRNLGAT